MSDKQPPIQKIDYYWPITGSIWANYNRNDELYFTFTLQRSYRKQDGDYDSSFSFTRDDVKGLLATIDACWHWIMTRGRELAREHKNKCEANAVTASPSAAG